MHYHSSACYDSVATMSLGMLNHARIIQSEIASNAALPEMLRTAFANLAKDIEMWHRPVLDVRVHNAMEGQGDNCRAAQVTAQVLGLQEQRKDQLADLRVCRDFRIADVDMGEPGKGLLERRVARFFEKQFDSQYFEDYEKTTRNFTLALNKYSMDIEVKGERIADPKDMDANYANEDYPGYGRYRVKAVSITLHSPNKYWFITQGLSSHQMFQKCHTFQVSQGHAFHVLEGVSGNVVLEHQEQVWHDVLDHLGEQLDFAFVDYTEAHETFQQVLDNMTRLSIYDRVDQSLIKGKLFSQAGNVNRRDNITGHRLQLSFGWVSIYTELTDAYSYESAVKKQETSHWDRDCKMFKVHEVMINGLNCESRTINLPSAYTEEFHAAVNAWRNEVIEGITFPERPVEE